MPIHDYVCESCGHVMEVVHGLHAEGPRECPQCGGPMSKAFSAPAVHFKGSGWAKKDRRSVSGPVKAKAATDGAGAEAAAGASAAPVVDAHPGGPKEGGPGADGG